MCRPDARPRPCDGGGWGPRHQRLGGAALQLRTATNSSFGDRRLGRVRVAASVACARRWSSTRVSRVPVSDTAVTPRRLAVRDFSAVSPALVSVYGAERNERTNDLCASCDRPMLDVVSFRTVRRSIRPFSRNLIGVTTHSLVVRWSTTYQGLKFLGPSADHATLPVWHTTTRWIDGDCIPLWVVLRPTKPAELSCGGLPSLNGQLYLGLWTQIVLSQFSELYPP